MLENAWEAIRWASKEIELGMDWESDNIIKKERFRDKSFFKFFNIFRFLANPFQVFPIFPTISSFPTLYSNPRISPCHNDDKL